MTAKNHEQRLLEINTLEWDELLAPENPNKLNATQEGIVCILVKLVLVACEKVI